MKKHSNSKKYGPVMIRGSRGRKGIRRLFVDPASTKTGWALFRGEKIVSHGTIQITGTDKFKRLFDLFTEYSKLMSLNLDEVHIECIPVAFNRRQAFNMKPLMYSVGVIAIALWDGFTEIYDDIIPTAWQKHVNWERKRKCLKRYHAKSEDELAAIFMGKYYLDKIKKEKKDDE